MPCSVESFASVRRWKSRVSSLWWRPASSALDRWCSWLRERGEPWEPDALVAMQAEAGARDRFRLVDLLEEWVQGLDIRAATKASYMACVRSFFIHNRAELPRDRTFKIRSSRERVGGSLSVREVQMVLARCNPCYNAMFLTQLMGGMGIGEILWFSDHGLSSLRDQLDSGEKTVRIDLPGRKQGRNLRPFYTFAGRDAIRALRAWLEERPRGRSESIFLNQFGLPVRDYAARKYWNRQLVSLGMSEQSKEKSHRSGKNLHEMRDLFRTRWHMSGADPSAAEFFMGHIIDKNEYDKAFRDHDYARSQYLKAEPWLNILTQEPDKVPRAEIEGLREELDAVKEALKSVLKVDVELERKRRLA